METLENPKPSAFCDLYKVTFPKEQNKRREQLLEEQKRRREELFDEFREIDEPVDTIEKQNKTKHIRKYKNRIMLSEWLAEVPPDIDVSWVLKFCPDGHRNLVVAHKNCTKAYSKTGRFEREFKSFLPGGCHSNEHKTSKITILDCIWSKINKTFYILDVLMWSNNDLTNCEVEFRFFWLLSRTEEIPNLQRTSTNNTYAFKYVPHLNCDHSLIRNELEKYPYHFDNVPKIDGLLFYHKEASYCAGRTPLVGWLKPFMVPEILNISVNDNYLKLKPKKYINLAEHIDYAKERDKTKHENNIEMLEPE